MIQLPDLQKIRNDLGVEVRNNPQYSNKEREAYIHALLDYYNLLKVIVHEDVSKYGVE